MARLWHCMEMATRHSPSAITERPAPRANPAGARPGEPFSLRAPRPMSWLAAEPGKGPRSILPPPPVSALPQERLASGSGGGPASSPTIRIGKPILPPRSRRVLWGVAAFAALAAVVLIANWRGAGRARQGSAPTNAEAACSSPGSQTGGTPANTSVPAHMTACWGPAIEPPVISVYELPAVQGPPPPTRRYGFRAPMAPAPTRAILATGAR